jgi:hypothetical protein
MLTKKILQFNAVRQKINYLLVGVVTAAITYYSVYPPPAGVGGGGSNYVLHVVAYFGLAAALLTHFHSTKHGIIESVALSSLAGIGIELIQYNLAFRTFSLMDIAANTAGAALIIFDYRGFAVNKAVELEDQALKQVCRLIELV